MEMILMAFATAFNFAILRWKLEHSRKLDALLDLSMLILLSVAFGMFGGTSGMALASLTSAIISVYLIFNPFHLVFGDMRVFKAKFNSFVKKLTIGLLIISGLALTSYVIMQFI